MPSPHRSPRQFLSPPHLSGAEEEFVAQAFASNYIAPLGPMVDEFEREFAAYTGIPHCLALTSGTAAIHLALRHLLHSPDAADGASGPPPLVLASTLTFIGSVSPAALERCEIRFIDSDRESWNLDPDLLEGELEACQASGRRPLTVIPTDLYGCCCNLPRIVEICHRFDVPVICDSAEAMGARYQTDDGVWRHAGCDAWASIYSFNGNKIITTSGGGMLASHDKDLIDHARKLSSQAREPAPYYQHTEIGFSYRMSNILAAIGRGQLGVLEERVQRRRKIFNGYRERLGALDGITFMPEPGDCRSTHWLTVILVDPAIFGCAPEVIRRALESENIEARPVWRPLHLQPVFSGAQIRGGGVAENLFRHGLCLPSGTGMTEGDLDRVCDIIHMCARGKKQV